LRRQFAGNAGTLQLLQLQDLGQERWEGEFIELYMGHSSNARESRDPKSNLAVANLTGFLKGAKGAKAEFRVAQKRGCF
jgi:hypothetical protein